MPSVGEVLGVVMGDPERWIDAEGELLASGNSLLARSRVGDGDERCRAASRPSSSFSAQPEGLLVRLPAASVREMEVGGLRRAVELPSGKSELRLPQCAAELPA